jgi:predicted RND superfamily exporter protein
MDGRRKMMPKKNFSDFVVRNRIIVIVMLILATLFFGYEITQLKLNADFSTYLKKDDPLVKEYNRIGEIFAGKSLVMVPIESENVFSFQTLSLMKELTDAYKNLPNISYVASLTSVIDFKRTEWGLEVGKLLLDGEIPQSDTELRRLRDYVLTKEMYVGDLVSEDGKAAIIVARLIPGVDEAKVVKEMIHITEEIAPSTENISFGGLPAITYVIMQQITSNFIVLLPILLGLIFLILFISFRKPGGIFLPLGIVLFAIVFVFGFIALFGLTVDFATALVPILLIAMGSADGIHFMKRYYERKRIGEPPRKALQKAFKEMWLPMLITTITSMVGFSSLLISEMSIIAQFGLLSALGIILALLITYFFLPAVLSFSKARGRYEKKVIKKRNNRLAETIGEFVYKRKAVVLVLAATLVFASVLGITKIYTDVDHSLCLKKNSKPYNADMLLRKKFGGSIPIQVKVEGDIKDPATLKSMRFVERSMDQLPLVSESFSLASTLSEMNDTLNGRYVVPETQKGVANLLFFVEGEDIMEQMVTSDYSNALIQAKLATWATASMVKTVQGIDQFVAGFPRSLAVIDMNEVPSQKRDAILNVRKKRIAENIYMDLRSRGIDVEKSRIEELINSALSQEELDEEIFIEMEREAEAYLLSDESEVAMYSQKQASRIASGIVAVIRREKRVLSEMIEPAVRSELEIEDHEYVGDLSDSLAFLFTEIIAERRIESAFRQLNEMLPVRADGFRELTRNLKGALWEMNENLMVMGLEEYQGISGGLNPPEIREVEISLSHTGIAPVLKKQEETLIPSTLTSMFIALVVVGVMLTLMFRSAVMGAISLIPIIMTIMVNYAVMGYGGIGLDSFTSMVAALAIGLGIDYAVHFNSRFKLELFKVKDELLALKNTLGTTGGAIVINALTVGVGFTVLLLAGGQHIRRFGGLTALTLFICAIFTLFVLPSLTLVFRPKFLREKRG